MVEKAQKIETWDEKKLLDQLGADQVGELEALYACDLGEGAYVSELSLPSKATKGEIEKLTAACESDLPLIILSRHGYTSEATETGLGYEDVLLCEFKNGHWIPLNIPA